ncbi:hypothetical protein [Cupriavidus metallidurans]|uniref:hypothetical protein n=1 Tax=Cupriavidus metallidurans TaxID=119219 RepID=UPI000CE03B40|nr:hypothetical protein [Cupriavidus metallidurans]AVA36302.1 hypothetical protein C3Z06_23610 [Cupriavidus metallidurans]
MSDSSLPRISAGELEALMAFPNDEAARDALSFYLRFDKAAASDAPVTMTAAEYLYLTSSVDLSKPEILRRMREARLRGLAAAWPLWQRSLRR